MGYKGFNDTFTGTPERRLAWGRKELRIKIPLAGMGLRIAGEEMASR
jgi:hypothetical protein